MTETAEDRLLTAAEVAARVSARTGQPFTAATWRSYARYGRTPAADDPGDPGAPVNRSTPRWRASTIDAWQDRREARGGRAWRATDTEPLTATDEEPVLEWPLGPRQVRVLQAIPGNGAPIANADLRAALDEGDATDLNTVLHGLERRRLVVVTRNTRNRVQAVELTQAGRERRAALDALEATAAQVRAG